MNKAVNANPILSVITILSLTGFMSAISVNSATWYQPILDISEKVLPSIVAVAIAIISYLKFNLEIQEVKAKKLRDKYEFYWRLTEPLMKDAQGFQDIEDPVRRKSVVAQYLKIMSIESKSLFGENVSREIMKQAEHAHNVGAIELVSIVEKIHAKIEDDQ